MVSNMAVISCIVPVYNKAKYLYDFMDSVIKQTFTMFEVILINDDSTDESLEILEKYAKTDKRIKLYTLENNMGAANARNYGFRKSRGEYVIFLDADDICDERMLEEAYLCCINHNADVCHFDFDIFHDEDSKNRINGNFNYLARKLVETYPILDIPHTFYNLFSLIITGPMNKLVKRNVIVDNHIFFQDIPNANDTYYSYMVCFFSEKIIFCDSVLLHYRTGHSESITSKRKEVCGACAYKEVYLELKRREYYKESNIFLIEMLLPVYKVYHTWKPNSTRVKESLKIFMELEKLYDKGIYSSYNDCHKELINKIVSYDFEESYIDILWKYGRDKFLPYLQAAINKGKRIAIWGAKDLGKDLFNVLKKEDICISFFIDNNMTLQNKYIEDIPIKKYDEIENDIDLILISSMRAFDDINKQINFAKETIDIVTDLELLNQKYLNNDQLDERLHFNNLGLKTI